MEANGLEGLGAYMLPDCSRERKFWAGMRRPHAKDAKKAQRAQKKARDKGVIYEL
jgi:hypothetical protein